MISHVKTSMETAGLPTDNLLSRRASLPDPVQQLHRRTLHILAQTGTPTTRGELEAWANDLRLSLDAALRQLAEAELVFVERQLFRLDSRTWTPPVDCTRCSAISSCCTSVQPAGRTAIRTGLGPSVCRQEE